jgi:hypothetical protein
MAEVLVKTLALAFAAIFVILAIMSLRVKAETKGKICCFFLGDDKLLTWRLIAPESELLPWNKKSGDKVKSLASKERQFDVYYPLGFPLFLQCRIKALMFVEGDAEPKDLFSSTKGKTIITEQLLQKISDDAVMKGMWRDMREGLGLKTRGPNTKTVLLVIVIIAAVVIALLVAKGGLHVPGL